MSLTGDGVAALLVLVAVAWIAFALGFVAGAWWRSCFEGAPRDDA